MKITDFIPQPFLYLSSQLSLSWFGRVVQPITTPLQWLFPFALLAAVFYAISKGYSNYKILQNPPLDSQFCKSHGIEFKSPILEKIKEIEEDIELWNEDDSSTVWTARTRVITKHANSLLALVVEKDNINQIIIDLKDHKKEIAQVFKTFKTEIGSLKALELETIENAKQEIEKEVSKRTVPVITTLMDYLQSVVPSDRLVHYNTILPERGVISLQDIDLLELRTWDQDLEALIVFKGALKVPSVLIQTALSHFLKGLTQKIQRENQKDYIFILEGRNDLVLMNYKNASDAFLKTLKDPQNISEIVQGFKNLYRLKQHCQLDAYIIQNGGHSYWTKLKKSNPQMHLANLSNKTDFYKLYY